MNRKELKEKAKAMIQGHIWELALPFIIVLLATSLLTEIVNSLVTVNSKLTINLLCDFLIYPMSFGTTVYILNFIRKKDYDIKMIFSFYNKFIYIVALYFIIGLFTSLWTMLLIIPGIIAALSYSMAINIMIDGVSDPLECIRRSKIMMQGYKWDYLKFIFSFIGWILLAIPTFGLILIYAIPYMSVSTLLYYEELKKITKFD